MPITPIWEEFGSIEKLVKAKGEIYQSLDHEGVSIINNNSPHSQTWIEMSNSKKFLFFIFFFRSK